MDKWKTFPCKICLLKGRCHSSCFQFPTTYHALEEYVIENQLRNTCLSCGSYVSGQNLSRHLNGCLTTCRRCV